MSIANFSGFYGDRFSALKEQVASGSKYLTGDYLAELTMYILAKNLRRGRPGYALTFPRQFAEVTEAIHERGQKVVTNAGGLEPRRLAEDLAEICRAKGVPLRVGYVAGDDLLTHPGKERLVSMTLRHMEDGRVLREEDDLVAANAYLGAFPIVRLLERGVDVVVTGRVADAALAVAPAAFEHGWGYQDLDALAGAVVAGHVIECGAQATGGNYSFFSELEGMEHPGFPVAVIFEDGSSLITKVPGTGGAVTRGTVVSQMLYEIEGPRYLYPDAVARFDTSALEEVPEGVVISATRGEPPPALLKASLTLEGGFRNTVEFMIPGPDHRRKAELALSALFREVPMSAYDSVETELIRGREDPSATSSESLWRLRVTVRSGDEGLVGRGFSSRATELALANYPGFFLASPPRDAQAFGIYFPTLVPRSEVRVVIGVPGEFEEEFNDEVPAFTQDVSQPEPSPAPSPVGEGRTVRAPLGCLFGARSGDKGGSANVGLLAVTPEAFQWGAWYLTEEKLKDIAPELSPYRIRRYLFPNLLSLNFVIEGILGEGAAANSRLDPQAKGLGEFLRTREVEAPENLIAFVRDHGLRGST